MIVLITGASHTGKTALAQKMLEKYKFPYISIDHIKMGLIRSGKTQLTPEDDDKLTDYLWPVIREMIKTAIENEQNLIVEGCYVPGQWKKEFSIDYLVQIKFICLVMSDKYIDMNYDMIKVHESDIEKRLYDSNLTKEKLKADNHFYLESFENITLIEEDYEKTIQSLLS